MSFLDVRSVTKKSVVSAVVVACLVFNIVGIASADPFGDDYDVLLDGFLTTYIDDGMGGLEPYFDTEGHLSTVLFDGDPGFLENDLVPDPNYFAPGNDLIVTETAVMEPDGSETISIWIEGQDPAAPFPTPGAPLFNNDLDPNEAVLFEVTGLGWPGMPGIVTGYHLVLTFGPLEVPIEPLFADIFDGAGGGGPDIDDPIEYFGSELYFGLDPADFVLPDGTHATDLHLEISVTHIPEPGSMALLAVGGVMLFGSRRVRRRRA